MIGNNDWLDYLAHSFKGTTWGDHKYIAIKNGRYIYPEDKKTSSRYNYGTRNAVPTGNDRYARQAERRNASRQGAQNRASTDYRVAQRNRTRSIEQSRRNMERQTAYNRGLNESTIAFNKQNSAFNRSAAERRAAEQQTMANRAINNRDAEWTRRNSSYNNSAAERRAAEQQTVANRAINNRDAEWRRQNAAYNNSAAERRAAEQQTATNRAANDRDIQWTRRNSEFNRSAAERRDAEAQGAANRAETDKRIEDAKPKNLFDVMGRRIGSAANAVGSAVSGAARSAGDAIGEAARKAGDWVGDRARDVDSYIDNNITGNSDRNYAKSKDDEARRAMDESTKALRNGDAGGFVYNNDKANEAFNTSRDYQNRADDTLWGRIAGSDGKFDLSDIQRHAGNAADTVADVGRSIGDGARSAVDAVGNAVSKAGDWIDTNVTGIRDRKYADYANNMAERNRDMEDWNDNRAATFYSWAKDGEANPGESIIPPETYYNWAHDADRKALEYGKAADKYEKDAKSAQDRADNSLFGKIGSATNAVGTTVSGAAQTVGNRLGSLYDAGRDAAGRALETANRVAEGAGNAWNTATGGDGRLDPEDLSRGANAAGSWVGDRIGDAGRAISGAASTVSEGARNLYNQAGQRIEQAQNDAQNRRYEQYQSNAQRYEALGQQKIQESQNYYALYRQTGNGKYVELARRAEQEGRNAFNESTRYKRLYNGDGPIRSLLGW